MRTQTIREIEIEFSRGRGLPCLWEGGGGYSNTGSATTVADARGRPKRPIYVRRRGHLACADHALIPVAVGDYVVEAGHHRRDFNITVLRLVEVPVPQPGAEGYGAARAEVVAEFSKGEWVPELPQHLQAAVEAAMEKATCYHCRSPHFVETPGLKCARCGAPLDTGDLYRCGVCGLICSQCRDPRVLTLCRDHMGAEA